MLDLLKQYGSENYYLEYRTLTVAVCPVFSVRRAEADSDACRLELGDGTALGGGRPFPGGLRKYTRVYRLPHCHDFAIDEAP